MRGALVPELRFPEFEGEWAEAKLGSIANFSKGKGISKADIDKEGKTPCVRYGELYTIYKTEIRHPVSSTNVAVSELKLSEGSEVIIPASGEDAKDIATAVAVLEAGIALGGDLNIIRGQFDPRFLANMLSGKKRLTLAALAQGNSVVHLYPSQLSSLTIAMPSDGEQQKIASFLDAISRKITLLTEKKTALEDYKRGVMQRLFSGALRFTQDDGTPFPDWEKRVLGDVLPRVRRKNDELCDNVLTISAQAGLVSQTDYFNKSVAGKDLSGYYLLKKGDFAYNKSYSKGYPMGAIKRLNKYDDGVVSSLYICFATEDESEGQFYEQYFESGEMNHALSRITQEGARNHGLLNIAVGDFFNQLRIPYPHPDEQRKIADFLSAIDAKIDAVSSQISEMETFKNGLLQKMFV